MVVENLNWTVFWTSRDLASSKDITRLKTQPMQQYIQYPETLLPSIEIINELLHVVHNKDQRYYTWLVELGIGQCREVCEKWHIISNIQWNLIWSCHLILNPFRGLHVCWVLPKPGILHFFHPIICKWMLFSSIVQGIWWNTSISQFSWELKCLQST